MNEACLNAKWIKEDLTHEKAQQFTKEVLNHMRERLSDYQEEYGDLYNLEATPAESTAYRLAKHDVEKYPNIITASEHGKTPYYTNSSHLPVGATDDIFSALDIQDDLQTLYTSGTVFHAFLGEKLPSWKAAAELVRKIASNYKLPYYTLSPTYSVCKNHGYIAGEVYKCPDCGEETEVYSRITGYYRPVKNWNDGKTEEFKERKLYDMSSSKLTHIGPRSDKDNAKVVRAGATEDQILLFTTKTCPNCKMAKGFLDDAKVQYRVINAEENTGLVKQFKVMSAPTLITVENGDVERYVNASNIRKYAESK
jgi:ribonucleoside-triphosphate reductase